MSVCCFYDGKPTCLYMVKKLSFPILGFEVWRLICNFAC